MPAGRSHVAGSRNARSRRLQFLAETWSEVDVAEAKADLLHAIYERITVARPTIQSVRLTPAAYDQGLALALPDNPSDPG